MQPLLGRIFPFLPTTIPYNVVVSLKFSRFIVPIDQFQPYLSAITAALSLTTLGFILSIAKSIRDNAQDRIAVQDERIKKADDDLKRTEKWAEREQSNLKSELDKAKLEIDALLKREGIDLSNLSTGKQLSDATNTARDNLQNLIFEMQNNIEKLKKDRSSRSDFSNPDWELSLAMGEMASGSFAKAAAHFDAYSKAEGNTWEANFTRGVAHANARAGFISNLASLRAYNEAIALAPTNINQEKRAKMFGYRGAMLKRLNRLDEAKSDLDIALSLAKSDYQLSDIRYNLACVYAMQHNKTAMMNELRILKDNFNVLCNISAHRSDYFQYFTNDTDFNSIVPA